MSDQPTEPAEVLAAFIQTALAAARGEPAAPGDDDAPKPKRDLGQGARGGGPAPPSAALVFTTFIQDLLDRPYR
jgi:hypothetical protein